MRPWAACLWTARNSLVRTVGPCALLMLLAGCQGGPAEGTWSGIGNLDPLDAPGGFEGTVVVMGLQVGEADEDWPLQPCGVVPAEARAEDPNAFAIEDARCTFEDLPGTWLFTAPRLEVLFVASDPIERTGTLQVGGEGEVSFNGAAPVAALLQASLSLEQPRAYGDAGALAP
ncbi:MAG: hypothetical protein HYS27_09900 [Deltaproteobacteria bacterium]|nr:hypothetical protein [Deltaproteobacteria bacterium]